MLALPRAETGYTDRVAYPFAPKAPPPPGFEEPEGGVPHPLAALRRGIAALLPRRALATLEEPIDKPDRMGHTSHLSVEERAALVAFLRTL